MRQYHLLIDLDRSATLPLDDIDDGRGLFKYALWLQDGDDTELLAEGFRFANTGINGLETAMRRDCVRSLPPGADLVIEWSDEARLTATQN